MSKQNPSVFLGLLSGGDWFESLIIILVTHVTRHPGISYENSSNYLIAFHISEFLVIYEYLVIINNLFMLLYLVNI